MDQTGGEMFDVQDVAHLDSVFTALIRRLKTRYTLGYYTTANGADGKPHKLDVRLVVPYNLKEGPRLHHFRQERLLHPLKLRGL